ncbi:purine transporter [Xylariomycetidae sp. FL2044]|nr:purine transporter [Xylariomycetidae sp. FL2044]
MGWVHKGNAWVARSFAGRYFKLEGSGHPRERQGSYFFTEIRAGLAAFFAMAYIIAVNASIVSDTGGPCICNGGPDDPICDVNDEYLLCVAEVKRDLVTATAAISALSSFCMGLFANLPVSLAPGMGLNAYFAYTVVGYHGTGTVPYAVALTAIFVEGWIFFALALFGMRQWLARAIPHSIKLATSVGIGLFLTIIGFTYSEGIGLLQGATSTPLVLAGCPEDGMDPETGLCLESTKMRNPTMWIGIFCGGVLTVMLMMYRVKGAIIAGILLVSIISWPRTTSVTYFPYTAVGNDSFDFFKQVVDFHKISKTLTVQQWDISQYGGEFGLALITFLYVDILDTTVRKVASERSPKPPAPVSLSRADSMARFAKVMDPVTEDFEGSTLAYMVDAISISIGSLLGCPPVTAFVESGAGISEGGRTGLTSMTTGICFFISIFFAPIFASIPPWATGCVLVLVGSMMMPAVTEINWKYVGDAVPAFLTICLMPFTYSIADGLIGGICLYITINTLAWLIEKASGGRIVPANKAEKDPWTWRMTGGILPPWMMRLTRGKKDFWRPDPVPVTESGPDGAGVATKANSEDSAAKGEPAVAPEQVQEKRD